MKILAKLGAQNNNFILYKYAISNIQQLTNRTYVAYYNKKLNDTLTK